MVKFLPKRNISKVKLVDTQYYSIRINALL